MSKGFIRYEIRNHVEYASVYRASRVDGKKKNETTLWLGKVIDKERGIYKNRKRGVFQYTLENGEIEYLPLIPEKLILDFGDSFFLNEMLSKCGFIGLTSDVFCELSDTIHSLIFYKILHGGASCHAQNWWEGSYSRMLFSKASLPSQRVSEVLRLLGDEALQRSFFSKYLTYISSKIQGSVLIDSTGLPNDIRFPLSAINNHNGVISNESRLILVLERESKLPIYFRYVAGNIVDVTTLQTTIAEMKEFGIAVNHAIVDAGYYSEKNIRGLRKEKVSFLLRMSTNRKLYKELIAEHGHSLENAQHLVKYRERFVFMKRVEIDLFGVVGYAYVSLDIERKHDELKKYFNRAYDDKDISVDDMNSTMNSKGFFVLVSSEELDITDVLPLYYTRQAIEQVFDFSKNNTDLLPLRIHGIDNFRGHLFISFLSSVAYILVNNMLNESDFCVSGANCVLRNLKCKVYDEKILVQEPNKKMNDIAKVVGLIFPPSITL